ncbi:MAG: SPOR domain-containing protein [Terriglobia bacterium]
MGRKGSHYEMVLEGRHLLGIFFGLVLLSALFFTLGFVLGRNQVASGRAGAPPAEKSPAAAAPTEPAADLSFYERVNGKPPPETLPAAAAGKKPAKSKPRAVTPVPVPPRRPRGSGAAPPTSAAPIFLQVAAFTREPEAKRLATQLERLGLPTVIRPARTDRFYRVQVGPFENAKLAAAAQRRLEAQGFRQFLKR